MKNQLVLVVSTDEELDQLATDMAEAAAEDHEVTIQVNGKTYHVSAEHVIVPNQWLSVRREELVNDVLILNKGGMSSGTVILA